VLVDGADLELLVVPPELHLDAPVAARLSINPCRSTRAGESPSTE
jgi:hypothetical protein